jgi:large subunit ribosomal protein L25
MSDTTLSAETGRVLGTRPSKRLRREGMVPAVLYGHGAEPVSVAVNGRELVRALTTEAGLNAILTLEVDGKKETALARELQRHPTRGDITHLDFLKISLTDTVETLVHIEFHGEPIGVKEEGGIVNTVTTSVNVRALVTNIPDSIEVDISALAIGDSTTVADLPEMEGVEFLDDPELTIATVAIPAAILADEEEELLEGEEIEGEEGEGGEDEDGESAEGEAGDE